MRKYLVLSLFLFTGLTAFAQMSEDKIIQYVQEQQAKGVSQEQIVFDLNKKGVTVQQLQRMREKYEKLHSPLALLPHRTRRAKQYIAP